QLSTINWPKLVQVSGINNANANFVHNCETGCLDVLHGDQLAIAKETSRRLGMGTNMYPSSSLLGQDKDAAIASLPVDELIEKADGFAGVFP
ncbi:hypothetical protein UlMin_039297, partial [Ulmus minor]